MVPMKTRFDPVYASVLNPEPYNDILVPPAVLLDWGRHPVYCCEQKNYTQKINFKLDNNIISFFINVHVLYMPALYCTSYSSSLPLATGAISNCKS